MTPITDLLIADYNRGRCSAALLFWHMRNIEESRNKLRDAIELTVAENLHLADGEVCTLHRLKEVMKPTCK